MEPFTVFTAVAVPLDAANVDTDQIAPARFLSKQREELPQYMFYDLRFDADGNPKPGVPFNEPAYRGARILVARDNFGCGSSRESAVWMLKDSPEEDNTNAYRCVIAPSYGDIFYSNCFKNGMLPLKIGVDIVKTLLAQLADKPGSTLTVDLPQQKIIGPDGTEYPFEIDSFQKECLVRGVEDIDITLELSDKIEAFEERRRAQVPWVVRETA